MMLKNTNKTDISMRAVLGSVDRMFLSFVIKVPMKAVFLSSHNDHLIILSKVFTLSFKFPNNIVKCRIGFENIL